MPEQPIVFYGCGTQGLAILEWVRETLPGRRLILTDDNPALWGKQLLGLPVIQPELAFGSGARLVMCGIGDNQARARVLLRLGAQGHRWQRFIHPRALVAPSAEVGDGSVILPFAVVNPFATVGEGCLINTHAVVEHHCQIEDFAHVAPRASLGGGCVVEEGALVGLGSAMLPGRRLGRGATLGAGAVLVRDAQPGAVLTGVPAIPVARSGQ
ncbi:MAG: acetyltransferase [Bryobacterales bacterium]|jgi:sugar O-acyltransferase (sialic acid O-acetyltransferase NeuD family)|nr:acetyltransferase [Bryobacterales bacterium]